MPSTRDTWGSTSSLGNVMVERTQNQADRPVWSRTRVFTSLSLFCYLHVWMAVQTCDAERVSTVPGTRSERQEQEEVGGMSPPGRAASVFLVLVSVLSLLSGHHSNGIFTDR